MANTLVIYDAFKDETEDGILYRRFRFDVQYPDGNSEEIEYARAKGFLLRSADYKISPIMRIEPNHKPGYDIVCKLEPLVRAKCLQRIVNKLENEGYRVYQKQLALSMDKYNSKLIMQKNK